MESEDLLRQLTWRYAVKKFDPTRKLPAATWSALEHAARLAPSSFGLQPWKFVVITDPEVKGKLPAISYGQMQPRDCSHYVVFAARKGVGPEDVERYILDIARQRGVTPESLADFKASMMGTVTGTPKEHLDIWTSRQVYISLGFFLAAAAVLGVDACPMEGLVKPEYDKLLGLEKMGYTTMCGAAAGYRAADDWAAPLKKVRFDEKDVIVRV